MLQLTSDQLRKIMPRCANPDAWTAALQPAMHRFGVAANKERVHRFLAQVAVESGELTRLEENLWYTPERLMQVWPKRFPTLAAAEPYARAPHKLANYVYANREGNGGPASGDGWRYRGRGPKMITFSNNYAWLGKELQLPLVQCPDMVLTKSVGALAAALFWSERGLNELADDLPDDDQDSDFVTITRRINGGTVGLSKRQEYLKRAEQVIL
jgi:putative chitinase